MPFALATGALADGPTAASGAPSAAVVAPVPAPNYDHGHIAWMLVSSALVLMMTGPGLALFYGGLVRKKNILGVMMQCLILMGMNSVLWAAIGYSLAFSDKGATITSVGDAGKKKEISVIGGLDLILLRGVGPEVGSDGKPMLPATPLTPNVPGELFMIFQMMFFIITPGLICGAFAERMKFSAMVVFTLLWSLIVYCPLAHWVWGPKSFFGGGSPYNALDFAGGLVVHVSSGVSALVCALVIGKRIGFGKEPMPPHSLTYTIIGACLLWVGWFGFNGGSAIAADNSAINAFVVTHLCAAAALLSWAGAEWLAHGKPTTLGACSGAVAGLVVITPASGFVTPASALIMGLIGGAACYFACTTIKRKFNYDDALDAFGVHGVGGTLGAILTGVFASKAVYADVPDNLLRNQFISIAVAYGLAIVGTFAILKIVDATVGLRVKADDEIRGLDLTQHNEEGYIFQ